MQISSRKMTRRFHGLGEGEGDVTYDTSAALLQRQGAIETPLGYVNADFTPPAQTPPEKADSFNWQGLLETAGKLAVQYGTAKLQAQTAQAQARAAAQAAPFTGTFGPGTIPGLPRLPTGTATGTYPGGYAPGTIPSQGFSQWFPLIALGGAGLLALYFVSK